MAHKNVTKPNLDFTSFSPDAHKISLFDFRFPIENLHEHNVELRNINNFHRNRYFFFEIDDLLALGDAILARPSALAISAACLITLSGTATCFLARLHFVSVWLEIRDGENLLHNYLVFTTTDNKVNARRKNTVVRVYNFLFYYPLHARTHGKLSENVDT